jgi:hypothetical protein
MLYLVMAKHGPSRYTREGFLRSWRNCRNSDAVRKSLHDLSFYNFLMDLFFFAVIPRSDLNFYFSNTLNRLATFLTGPISDDILEPIFATDGPLKDTLIGNIHGTGYGSKF